MIVLDGILNIYKEKGYTSHDVVAVVRKILQEKRVGHTGTLDVEAEGVLPICVGKATKAAEYLTEKIKAYTATVCLGVSTTTEDHTGEVVETCSVDFDIEKITEAVGAFQGEYLQVPPMYSALKVQGKKLYELARQGKTIERKARPITIYQIEVKEWLPPDRFVISVVCSKGTYIRTLCVDIGKKLGCEAHMCSLLRTKSGMFSLEDSITLEQLRKYKEEDSLESVFVAVEDIFSEYGKVIVKQNADKALKNGNRVYEQGLQETSCELVEGQLVKVYDHMRSFIGIYMVMLEEQRTYLKPQKLFF